MLSARPVALSRSAQRQHAVRDAAGGRSSCTTVALEGDSTDAADIGFRHVKAARRRGSRMRRVDRAADLAGRPAAAQREHVKVGDGKL